MRIRTHLLVLVFALLMPALLAAALGIAYVYSEEQASRRESLRETARALALVLDKEISKREAILHSLAASPALDRGDFDLFYQHARRVASDSGSAVILSDASGQPFLNTRLPLDVKKMPVVTSIQELRKRYGVEKTIVSNIYFAPVGKSYSFSVEIPVRRGDRILYFIEMGSFAGQLQAVFEEQRLPEEWTGTIVDRDGIVVARSKEPEKYVGMRASAPMLQKVLSQPEGFNEGKSLSGQPVVAFFNRAPQSEWSFIVSVPQKDLLRSARHAAALTSGTSLLLLGLAVIGALAMARRTAKPIEALRRAAERLGRGEPVSPVHSGIVEMDAVSAAMVRAGDDIRSGKEELERRVEEAVETAKRSQRALLHGQKLEALGRLTGGIAHDFNNVLQTLTTGLEVAQLSSGDGRVKASLDACHRAVRRATELTGQLLAFGRVQDARFETVDLPRQIEAMTPMLQAGLRSDIDFRLDVAEGLWPVTLDPLQFELALLNLAINARDAMPQRGTLRLEARNETIEEPRAELAPGDYVRISIIDTGEGMSPEVLARAMEPFFTTKGVGKGTGMGLSQAYGFAKQSNGLLLLRSRPGEGTAAIFYLPRAALPKAAHPAKLPEPGQPMPRRTVAGATVMFVEDDPLVRDVVRPVLQTSGFDVTVANDGEQALALLETGRRFDLVFSDIVMPGPIGGIELAAILRTRFPHLRIILATGYSDRPVPLSGIRILAKPYDMHTLVDTLIDELQD